MVTARMKRGPSLLGCVAGIICLIIPSPGRNCQNPMCFHLQTVLLTISHSNLDPWFPYYSTYLLGYFSIYLHLADLPLYRATYFSSCKHSQTLHWPFSGHADFVATLFANASLVHAAVKYNVSVQSTQIHMVCIRTAMVPVRLRYKTPMELEVHEILNCVCTFV